MANFSRGDKGHRDDVRDRGDLRERGYRDGVTERRSDLGSHESDMASHPDVREMQDRYRDRDEQGYRDRDAQGYRGREAREETEGRSTGGGGILSYLAVPAILLGLYCAVSPWITHNLLGFAVHNLIIGLVIAGLAMMIAARRGNHPLGWGIAGIGVWMIISPWVVARATGPSTGVIANNVTIGALSILLGAALAFMGMKALKSKSSRSSRAR
jgi:hypothetical protein